MRFSGPNRNEDANRTINSRSRQDLSRLKTNNPCFRLFLPMYLLTNKTCVAFLECLLIRVTARFFSGVLHPHLLGVCCPNLFLFPNGWPLTRKEGSPSLPLLERGCSSIG